MNTFKAGFGRVNITPPLGTCIAGYTGLRVADGILDELEANCLAVSDGENTAVLISCDLLDGYKDLMDGFRNAITAATGVPYDNVMLGFTHIHTGPYVKIVAGRSDDEYLDMLKRKLVSAAQLAIADLAPATADMGRNTVHKVGFIRRFLMKDGTVKTGPGFNNPDVVGPAGEADETLQVLRFNREGAKDILVTNFQVHADMVGGTQFSADYPRYLRDTVELVFPDAHCLYFNGPEGNMGGMDWDNPAFYDRTYHTDPLWRAKHAGRCLAAGVMQIYEKLTPVELGPVRATSKTVQVLTNRETDPDKITEAQHIHQLHAEDRDDEIPGSPMEKTTAICNASRILRLKDGPDFKEITVYGISFGDVAFVGFPGEPFTEVGIHTKARAPYAMTVTCALVNGYDGYFPTADAYVKGSYEASASNFAPGVAETLTDAAVEMLNELRD